MSKEIQDALAAPFAEGEVEFLPRAVREGKALALAYIDARNVMSRLDAVVGMGDWSFDYDVIPCPANPKHVFVKGKLTVCGVTKCDAGEAEGEDEPLKSAVSDALKRCGVHFGIGRYLHHADPAWFGYDASRKKWTETPRLRLKGAAQSTPRPTPQARREAVKANLAETAPEVHAAASVQAVAVDTDTGEVLDKKTLIKECASAWRQSGRADDGAAFLAELMRVSGEDNARLPDFSFGALQRFRDHLRAACAEQVA